MIEFLICIVFFLFAWLVSLTILIMCAAVRETDMQRRTRRQEMWMESVVKRVFKGANHDET